MTLEKDGMRLMRDWKFWWMLESFGMTRAKRKSNKQHAGRRDGKDLEQKHKG